jgi:RHS repeat-associated protein
MLATDHMNSVLSEVSPAGRKARAYTAYGYSADDAASESGLGHNGELRDSNTGEYFLGKGYRLFSTQMMRFYSPDSWSPFGEGGVNAYGYVAGDPIKYADPTGHVLKALGLLVSVLMPVDHLANLARTGRATLQTVGDPLAGWLMHTVDGVTVVPAAIPSARATPIANVSRNIAAGAADVGRSAPKSVKQVAFDSVTKINEYKQRMGPEHWTSLADERRAVAEVMSQELGAGAGNVNPSSTVTQPMQVNQRIRQNASKKLTVRQQAMSRRFQ